MGVIGPISRETWNTMRLLRGSIQWDKLQFNPALKQSTDWLVDEYNFYLSEVVKG